MTAALELDGVVLRYRGTDRPALDGLDLTLGECGMLALLGPNGAGKSTLVSLAAGLLRPDAGTVRVLGADPCARGKRIRREVGVAPQEIGVYPQLTVTTNLRCFAELYGLRPRAARARAAELLAPFALEALADRPAGRLSGGEQRRLHAAIALVNRPRLVIFDEPTAGADPSTRDHILQAVRDLARDGTAVVYTTHYLPEVERLDADVALLEDGRLIARGSVAELVARHASPVGAAAGDAVAPPSLETAYLALTGRANPEPLAAATP